MVYERIRACETDKSCVITIAALCVSRNAILMTRLTCASARISRRSLIPGARRKNTASFTDDPHHPVEGLSRARLSKHRVFVTARNAHRFIGNTRMLFGHFGEPVASSFQFLIGAILCKV